MDVTLSEASGVVIRRFKKQMLSGTHSRPRPWQKTCASLPETLERLADLTRASIMKLLGSALEFMMW